MNIDKTFSKSLDEVLKVLKKHGVESFKHGELELKISPVKYISSLQNEQEKSKSKDKVTEDDLFYSSSPLRKVK
jgi:hypothetical protein